MEQPAKVRIWAFVYPSAVPEVLRALAVRTEGLGLCDWVLVPLRRPDQPSYKVPVAVPGDE